ncbi:tetratricopeptide repeat protein [bacterium]|nr:tetratricopeptide repeat protein [bacterium]
MIRSHSIACLSFLLAGALPAAAPAFALDLQNDCDAIRAMAAKRPNDLELRYRLAECYLNTGRVDAAKRELSLCIKYGGKSPVALLAGKRITELTESGRVEAEIEKVRSELLARLETEKKQASQRFDLEIKAIEKSTAGDAEKERRMKAAFTRLKKEEERLTSDYQRRADQLASQRQVFKKSAGAHEKMRLVPALSNTRVRNYENLGDESDIQDIPEEAPLKADQKKLR